VSYVQRFKDFVAESGRVLRVTKKPTKEEYKTITKVSGLGIVFIGLIGGLFHIIRELSTVIVVAVIVVALVVFFMFIKK
jgi:protein transport protein SEC61 subunit gamma and related proteins